MRTLVEVFRDHVLDKGDVEALVLRIPDMLRQLERVGMLVDKMVSIDQKYALTASQLVYVQTTVVDVMRKYLEDPVVIEMAANELSSRLGTGEKAVLIQDDHLLTVGG